MDLQQISKFTLQRLLCKDTETRKNIKQICRVFEHNILLAFNISNDLHIEFSIKLYNTNNTPYTIDSYNDILSYVNKFYQLNSIISCNGYIFKNDKVGTITEWYIIEISDNSKIGITACLDSSLDENVISKQHLVSLNDVVVIL